MDYNAWFIAIVLGLFLMWKLDLFATLLNLKALSREIPATFEGFVDGEAYEQSQEYTRVRAVFGLGEGIFSLVLLFVFWWLGGFGWLDEQVRSLGQPHCFRSYFCGDLDVGASCDRPAFQPLFHLRD